jgi:hypothetical protein
MDTFRDKIVDKYKNNLSLDFLNKTSKEFLDLRIHVIKLVKEHDNDKKNFLFNGFYYQDLFKIIKLIIIYEVKNFKTYKDRLLTVTVGVDTIENYFIDQELQLPEYSILTIDGKMLYEKNNYNNPENSLQEFEIDVNVVNADLMIDIKSRFSPYNQVSNIDQLHYSYLEISKFLKYYNEMQDKNLKDVWLLIYYNYNEYNAGYYFLSIKQLSEYFNIANNNIKLNNQISNINIYKKEIEYKIIDVDYTFDNIIFDFALCYTKNEFIQYLNQTFGKKYIDDDVWI